MKGIIGRNSNHISMDGIVELLSCALLVLFDVTLCSLYHSDKATGSTLQRFFFINKVALQFICSPDGQCLCANLWATSMQEIKVFGKDP